MALGLVALVLWSYWPALRGGLLWDDDAHLTRPELRSWDGLVRIWTDLTATQQYYPVLHSAFWLEHRLWGDATLPYHLLNMALHALACLLLVAVLRRLWPGGASYGFRVSSAGITSPDPRPETQNFARVGDAAWLAGFLFAVHPVAVESVAWISEQKNTLSLVFYLAAGLAYLRFDRSRSGWAYAGAFALYALAVGTKSVTATLPAALLVVLWWQRGTLSFRRDVLPLAPWLAFGVGAGLFTAWVEYTFIGAQGGEFDLTAWQRVLLAARIASFYVGKLLWPADLMFIYPRWDAARSAGSWWPWLLGLLGVTLACWRIRHRNRGLLAGWLFFLGSLVPALGFVNVYPFRFSYVADHFQYLPSLGLIALLAAGLTWVQLRAGGPASAGEAGSAVDGATRRLRRFARPGVWLVPLLALLTYRQAEQYRDVETLFRTTLARNPGCWMAHLNLGVHLAKTPATKPAAIEHFRATLALLPDCAEAHYNLANELVRVGAGGAEAIHHYLRALAAKPDYAQAHYNLALQLQQIPGREAEALRHLAATVRIDPTHARAHNNLGILLAATPSRLEEAIAHFEAAVNLQPDFSVARANLASAYNDLAIHRAQLGRLDEAVRHVTRALTVDPSLAPARRNLELLRAQVGR